MIIIYVNVSRTYHDRQCSSVERFITSWLIIDIGGKALKPPCMGTNSAAMPQSHSEGNQGQTIKIPTSYSYNYDTNF